MSLIIAGLYEINKQIGAGGGGVVYLGTHLRLGKSVVLKADKRSLSAGEETLRREVDLLKKVSHTYIPQVYDYVQENGVVYTVMDYIDGESLDKLIAQEQLPTQAELVKWARQLLDALVYLHNYPPYGILHGDIKPANIMKRPNGDICLIDFNIALALGEEGAVKVGYSRGYASPEHYGADYIVEHQSAAGKYSGLKDDLHGSEKTVAADDGAGTTVVLKDMPTQPIQGRTASSGSSAGSASGGKKGGILLDVRSDIYSLGATLYHLISGRKPAQDAREVVPLGPDVCSPAVAAIIKKAMAPMPEDRYQTAEEMLAAFHKLWDMGLAPHRRRIRIFAAVMAVSFLAGGACTFIGLKQLEQRQAAMALAEYSANALAEGDVSAAVQTALRAIPEGDSILDAPVTAQAQKALTDALGVYDLSDGFKALDTVELPGAPFSIAVSPEGSRFAAVYAYEVAVFDTAGNRELARLPAQMSALSDAAFLDESRIIYAGEEGVTAYDLDAGKVLWSGEEATTLSLSADKRMAAAVNRDADHAVVYRTDDGGKAAECDFGGLHLDVPTNDIFADAADYIFELNEDGSMLAVSFHNGGLTLFDVKNPDDSLIVYEESDYIRFEGGFCGKYFAYGADRPDLSSFGLIDTEKAAFAGGFDSPDNFFLQADERGIFLASGNLLVDLNPETLEQTELAYTDNVNIKGFSIGEEYVLVTTEDNCFSFYDRGAHLASKESFGESCDFAALTGGYAVLGNRDKPLLRLLKLERHEEAQLLSYDARYAHDEARVSEDGRTIMLFDYEKFRIYDRNGEIVAEEELPDAGQIYDQQFRRSGDGSYLEVIWYDGTVRHYSAADGGLLLETKGEAPDRSLTEEFTTERYRIVSPLHETPTVYELDSGRQVGTLERDDYLTYVTQAGEYIMTEYISTEGRRYGLLLNGRLETLAYLPNLCDIAGDELVFDYESGDLRRCRLYSLEELVEMGESYR